MNANWTTPIAPFRIADNLYYVGSRDLAAYLVTTPQGDILINANYTSSPPQIRRAVESLGFHWRDIKILLISHAHVDHAGGAAEIVRETGATFEVMDGDADVMESGGRTDFAFGGATKAMQFPPAHVDRVLHDGEPVTLGGVTLTAHKTAGHTRGCTTWTLKAHVPGEPAGTLRNVVIVGSWSVLSEYRLLAVRGGKPASYPGIASDYTKTFAELHALPCDVFLASHGSLFDMPAKLKRMPSEGDRVWIDPEGYKAAVAQAQHAFEVAYEREAKAAEQSGSR
ncbi:MAG TPA: subclass B3 metallo-beta-lactamase [Acidobacteriaceae bacterium]|nr:subclass B3 metallo-beta-lactamase [Acidobacteriaceae bacterium]